MRNRVSLIIIFLFTIGICEAQYPPVFKNSVYGNNPDAGHYINIRGFKMYYEVYGKGEPMLMIHGNAGSINNLSGQIEYFSKYYQVIIADSRAHGKSTDTSDTLSYKMMADDFNALLDSLQIKSCNVLGWSDGGNNGLLMAIHYPEKIKKLVISGANTEIDSTAIAGELVTIDQLGPLYVQEQTPETINLIKVTKLLFMLPGITRELLQTIKCPTLVIGGDHDVIIPKHTLYIAENIPNANLWILPNSGHSTLIFHKELFNQTVAEFFNKPYRTIKGMDRLDW